MVRRYRPRGSDDHRWWRRAGYAIDSVSPRGWGVLIVGGIVSFGRGWSYFGPTSPTSTPPQLVFVEQLVPLWVYGIGWSIVGVLCIATVLVGQLPRGERLSTRVLPTAVGTALFFNALWATSFVVSELQGVPRSFVSALSYIGLAVSMWLIGKMGELPEADR